MIIEGSLTLQVLVIGMLGWIAWELIAVGSKLLSKDRQIPTISAVVWKWGIDRGVDGAPIIFLMGFLMGHFVLPPHYTGDIRIWMISLSVTLVAYEVAALAVAGLRSVSRYLWTFGGRFGGILTFSGGFLIGAAMFAR